EIRDVAKAIPIDSILIETDSPYLAPAPNRGKTNEPSYVRYVLEEVARVKDLPIDVVAQKTTENFHRLFLDT
ncbi:MAG: TatD family hydrolase, partial [Betaproteobacteria bacterium]